MRPLKTLLLILFLLLLSVHNNAQTFTRITEGPIFTDGGSSLGASWGDYNGDGYLDLFVANEFNNGLYRNNGNGTFSKITNGPVVEDVANSQVGVWGDYDNDGDIDLFVANTDGQNNALYRNDGDVDGSGQVRFQKITSGPLVSDGISASSARWGDFDNDGDIDLFVANTNNQNNFLYQNNGDGSFNAITEGDIVNDGGDSFDAAWGDYDNDGDIDLFVSNRNDQNNFLYRNDGKSGGGVIFTKNTSGVIVNSGGSSRGCSWGDYDNDGDIDLFVANTDGQNNFLYRNDGDPDDSGTVFTRVSGDPLVSQGGNSRGCSWGDMDNDGDLDLLVTNSGLFGDTNFMYRNNGNGSFASVSNAFTNVGRTRTAPWGDYDNDGDLDIIATSLNNNSLLRNEGTENHWISITGVGTVSNASAIGARVSIKTRINGAAVWQTQEISGQGGGAQNSLNAEFGLGDATVIDSIRVRWPSGAVTDTTNVAADRFLTFTEPQFVRITGGDIGSDVGRSHGASWGDYDNDGDPDLFVANTGGENNFLYENNGGIFVRVIEGAIANDGGNSQGATWGDYDNDGYPDLFVSNAGGDNFLYHNDGDGRFTNITGSPVVSNGGNSKGAAWGDYDNDGDLDLFVANDRETNFLYQNNGDGIFLKITGIPLVTDVGDSFGANWVDYDRDGDLDLFVANFGNNFLYQNEGTGNFTPVSGGPLLTSQGTQGSSWADFDNDGDPDVLLTSFGEIVLFRNEGPDPQTGEIVFTNFKNQEIGNLWQGSSWSDHDNDGDLDIFVAGSGNNFFWQNNGNGNLIRVTAGAIVNDGGNSTGAAWADYDRDGLPDLFVSNNNSANFLYNTGGTGNHWLNILPVGRTSNAAAIGAKVSVTAILNGFRVIQLREISAQSGYLSQNSLNAAFGLKDALVADSIRIRWPAGAVNSYFAVPVNQFLVYEENNRPQVENAIPLVTLDTQRPEFVRGLLAPPVIFSDADGDTLRFQAATNHSTIATAAISGSQLTVSLVSDTARGQARITLTALDGRVDDGRGDTESSIIEINRPPRMITEISGLKILRNTSGLLIADLNDLFDDPDGQPLDYQVSSSDSLVAVPTLTGSVLTVSTSGIAGKAQITLSAEDVHGEMAAGQFAITNLLVNLPPKLNGSGISDREILLDGPPLTVNLRAIFTDPEEDPLMFSGISSNSGTATATVLGDTLTVVPRDTGQAVITVRANDGFGNETSTGFRVEVLRSFRPRISHAAVSTHSPGQAIAIDASISDDEGALANITLNYRTAGDPVFETVAMALSPVDDTTFAATGTVPGSFVTDRGLEYFVLASDTHQVFRRVPDAGVFSVRVQITAPGLIKSGAQPGAGGDDQTAYRLISVPMELNDQTPQAVLEDNLGTYDPVQWRLFQWVPLVTGDVARVEFPNDILRFSPGEAIWLIVKNSGRIIDSGAGTTVSTEEPFEIQLERGWNLIGNPFNFPTVAADTLSNGNPVELFAFDGAWSAPLDPTTTLLQPFEGYAVFSISASSLLINPNPTDGTSTLLKSSSTADTALWSLRIRAQCQNARDDNNIISIIPGASPGWDHRDHPEPPGVGEFVSLYFPHPEWERLNHRFSSDTRPQTPAGHTWEFEIVTNIHDVVDLHFEGIETLPSGLAARLTDPLLKTSRDLRRQPGYSLAGGTPDVPRRLALVVGSSAFVEQQLQGFEVLPAAYQLYQNFPNPFNPVTTIPYALPQASRVHLSVYNVLGQKVVTLLDNQLQPAGNHAVVWNGRNALGSTVSSGMYFIKIQAGDFIRFRKMLLIQ